VLVATQDNRSTVERYAKALPGDFATLAILRHPDFVEDWPQSGERIRGHANYQAIHENYPGGLPDLKPRRIVGSEDRWVVSPSFTTLRIIGTGDIYVIHSAGAYAGGATVQAVAILELRDGKIAKQTTFFASAFEAPAWRARWVERV
jgi:SnoaL-like protein